MPDRTLAVPPSDVDPLFANAQVSPPNRRSGVVTAARGVVVVTRLARPFASPEDALFGCRPMLTALDTLGRKHYNLLFDSRYAVACNNPEYESWFAPYRRALVFEFSRVGLVIRTSAGALQSRRLLRADTQDPQVRVFENFDTALSFVSEQG
jgi:hypothetical protein